MALTNSKYISEGVVREVTGSLSGTYTASSVTSTTENATIAAGVMTITPGFIPKFFEIVNCTDRLTQKWFQGMNTGDFIETVAAGDQTLETDDMITVSPTTGVIVVTFSGGAVTDNDTVIWRARG